LTALIQSILIFLCGPLVAVVGTRKPFLLPILDGFVLVSISGMVLLEVIPHAMESVGFAAIGLALAGLMIPTIIEKTQRGAERQAHDLALLFGVLAILLHSMIDGVMLSVSTSDDGESSGLTWAIIIHRLPEGLAAWWLLRPSRGRRVALGAVILGALLTVVGWFGGAGLQTWVDAIPTGALMALMGGALLHVIVHSTGQRTSSISGAPWLAAGGAMLGILFIYIAVFDPSNSHSPTEATQDFFDTFMMMARTSAGPLLIAYIIAGMIHALLPKATVDWMGRGSTGMQAVRGLLFGLPLPICSCGVLPLYRSLVERGVPIAAAVTLLVATPELEFGAVLLTFQFIGQPFAIARIIAAAVLALVIGLLAVKYIEKSVIPPSETPADDDSVPLGKKIIAGLRVGLGDLVDSTAPWIVLGLALAALLKPMVEDGDTLAMIPGWLQVPAFALLGLPFYVCALGATPLAAVLIVGGASPGAALAFLLTGPATNVTTYGILSDLHGKRAAILFAVSVGLGAIGCGYAVDATLAWSAIEVVPEIGAHEHSAASEGSVFDLAKPLFLALLTLLFVTSVFRTGPRPFLGQVFGIATDDGSGGDDSCCSSTAQKPEPSPGKG